MKLSREQLFEEMGLGPVWRLRSQTAESQTTTAVASGAPTDDAPAIALPHVEDSPPPQATVEKPLSPNSTSTPATTRMDAKNWPELNEAILTCTTCTLCRERKQAVPGVGDTQANWLFIGEGPGAEEDARGEPFVGQAGKLLDAMLSAIDLKRGENVYITNAVKCRPPGNRTPKPEEIEACRPFLQQQIRLIQPKLIVLLGRAAVQVVLKEERTLGASRGKLFEYRDDTLNIPVIATYHPAYLLRNLADKAKAWEDLCFARRTIKNLCAE